MPPIADAVAGVGQAIAGAANLVARRDAENNTVPVEQGAVRAEFAAVIEDQLQAIKTHDIAEIQKQLAVVPPAAG